MVCGAERCVGRVAQRHTRVACATLADALHLRGERGVGLREFLEGEARLDLPTPVA
jgi:hypothetical protein